MVSSVTTGSCVNGLVPGMRNHLGGGATIMYGHSLSVLLDFIVLSVVVYFFVKGLGLDKLDKKK